MPKGYSAANQRAGSTLAERLAYYSDRSGGVDACWQWTGARHTSGYGSLQWNGRTEVASRLAWTDKHGPIPSGMYVCHRCDNPLCVKADHLFLGTQRVNILDMCGKGRHAGRVLEREQVLAIRGDVRTQAEIARDFHVSQTTVSRIKRGASYADIAG